MSKEQDCIKAIFDICKSAEATIKEHKADKTLVHPIDADFIKTEKVMSYEEILSEVKKYAASKRADKKGANNGN